MFPLQPPPDPQLRLLANTMLPEGLASPQGQGHTRRHLGPSLGQRLLKMVPVLGKTVPSDTLSLLLDHGLHHFLSPPSHAFFENGIACLSCVWLRAGPCQCLSTAQKLLPGGYGCSLHPRWGNGPWGIRDTIRGAEQRQDRGSQAPQGELLLSGGAQGGLTGAQRKAADMSRSGAHIAFDVLQRKQHSGPSKEGAHWWRSGPHTPTHCSPPCPRFSGQ